MTNITISIDAMGGDHGVSVTVPAAIRMLQQHPDLHLILVGFVDALESALQSVSPVLRERLKIHPASEEVFMDESPAVALRTKKDSSMRLAIDLVKDGQADACVSAGNTGALMATARFVLKMLPGIDRPAIVSSLPTEIANRQVLILDLGANVDCTADHLYQFAVMGSVLASAFHEESRKRVGQAKQQSCVPTTDPSDYRPIVALLSNGEEEIKGNEQVKEAARLLSETQAIHFVGYIEADDVFLGGVDVVVCDGFVGNVALKTIEGTAHLITYYLKKAFMHNRLTQLAGWLVRPILRRFRDDVDPRKYNGASLLGLRGIVVKSHGHADITSFENAIKIAIKQAQQKVPGQIAARIETYLKDE